MRHRLCRIVVIESPYKAHSQWELDRNLAYARALVRAVTLRGDSPTASHLLITQSIDDRHPDARECGIAAGLAMLRVADIHAFGVDLGWSGGMQMARKATPARCHVEELSLPEWRAAAEMAARGDMVAMTKLIEDHPPMWWPHE